MKQISFHPEIEDEIASAMDYYAEVAGSKLATEFHDELIRAFHRLQRRQHDFIQLPRSSDASI